MLKYVLFIYSHFWSKGCSFFIVLLALPLGSSLQVPWPHFLHGEG